METIGAAYCGNDGRYAFKVYKQYVDEKPEYILYYVDTKLGRIEMIEHLSIDALRMFKIMISDCLIEGVRL